MKIMPKVPLEFDHLVKCDDSELTPHTDDLSARKGIAESYCQGDTRPDSFEKFFAAPPVSDRMHLLNKRYPGSTARKSFVACVDKFSKAIRKPPRKQTSVGKG